ncbi:MAG: YbjN domain-containing protein [Acidimicrobiales bacterium]
MTVPAEPPALDALATVVDHWLAGELAGNPAVAAVEAGVDGPHSWYVRMNGEAKDAYTVRFHLRQRTLRYETYFMPAPVEQREQLFEHLLRRNAGMYGGGFVVGEEDAVFISGRLAHALINPEELDRVLGSVYAWVEQYFLPAVRIGFASRFRSGPTEG